VPSGNIFFVDSGAHDSGRPVEHEHGPLCRRARMLASSTAFHPLYAAVQPNEQQSASPAATAGNPIWGRGAYYREGIQKLDENGAYLKANDQEYHLNVSMKSGHLSTAGALFDYVLDPEGKIIHEPQRLYPGSWDHLVRHEYD
jgi:hypothetical protein